MQPESQIIISNKNNHLNVNIAGVDYELNKIEISKGYLHGRKYLILEGNDNKKICEINDLLESLEFASALDFEDDQIETILKKIFVLKKVVNQKIPERPKLTPMENAFKKAYVSAEESSDTNEIKKRKAFRLEPPKKFANPQQTIAMKEVYGNYFDYTDNEIFLQINDKQYKVITSEDLDFCNQASVSCGSSIRREFLLLDPNNSPVLNEKYEEFESYLKNFNSGQLHLPTLISAVNQFVRLKIFSCENAEKIDAEISQMVKEAKGNPDVIKIRGTPCLSIDDFISKKIGVCRHHSLVAAYFLDKFLKNNPSICDQDYKVQIVRDSNSEMAHAWISIISKDKQIYLLDSLNNLHGNLADKKFKEEFEDIFGKGFTENQLIKAREIIKNYYSDS